MSTRAQEEVAPSMDEIVGRRVHQLMWDQKITQVALGKRIGLDQSSVAKRLRGQRGWSLDDIARTAEALSVSIAVLFGEDDLPHHPGTRKGPAGGAAGPSLPELDSNQQPAG